MKSKITICVAFLFISLHSFSQWEASAGAGVSIPITSYAEVVKTGVVIFNLTGSYRLHNGIALGIRVQDARFAKDKNAADTFYGAKVTVAPVLATIEYSFNRNANLQPYISGGFGISFFAVSYNASATGVEDRQINNVSFTMMPLIGLRYKANQHIFPYLETGLVMITDGPPQGFPKSEKLTGYYFVTAGVQYRF